MSDRYLGQILMIAFNFAPRGTVLCNGQVLPISQYDDLFALIGTSYGGDGTRTFGVPNLPSRAPAGAGTLGNENYPLGFLAGTETVTLTLSQNGPHTHGVSATTATGSTDVSPGGLAFAATPATSTPLYGPARNMATLGTTSVAGGAQPHENMQPYLAINFVMVTEGRFPPQQ